MKQPSWNVVNNKLEKVIQFRDFMAAIAFINQVALLAEAEQHHPDLQLYDYKNVRITLFTHSQQKITDQDRALAALIDKLMKTKGKV